jgi:hypothetical protein
VFGNVTRPLVQAAQKPIGTAKLLGKLVVHGELKI